MSRADWVPAGIQNVGTTLFGIGLPVIASQPIAGLSWMAGGVGVYVYGWHLTSQMKGRSTVRQDNIPRDRGEKLLAGQRKVLILFLSKVNIANPISPSGDLDADLQEYAKKKKPGSDGQRPVFWSWEQSLRAIHHNLRDSGPLERLILIASKESAPSMPDFIAVLQHYGPFRKPTPKVRIETYSRNGRKVVPAAAPNQSYGVDFEDFEELTWMLDGILAHLVRNEDVSDDDIQIDLTGGQKPTSVVAAAVTMGNNVTNQYVATNPRDPQAEVWEYEVLGYELLHQPLP